MKSINTNPPASDEVRRLRARVSAYESLEFCIKLNKELWGRDWDVNEIAEARDKIIAELTRTIVDEIVAEGPHE